MPNTVTARFDSAYVDDEHQRDDPKTFYKFRHHRPPTVHFSTLFNHFNR